MTKITQVCEFFVYILLIFLQKGWKYQSVATYTRLSLCKGWCGKNIYENCMLSGMDLGMTEWMSGEGLLEKT